MTGGLYSVMTNWNSHTDTSECVRSLLAAGAMDGSIVIVDNGSQDGSAMALRSEFGAQVTVIENVENLGFARGMNLGLQYVLACGAEWVLILNNDVVVDPSFFEALAAAQATGRYSLLAPIIYFHDQPERVWSAGDHLILDTLLSVGRYKNQEIRDVLPKHIPVDFITGCGMLIRRDVLERIGAFDPGFFMYAEDADFCWRARQAGFRAACVTDAKMWHKVSSSANRVRPQARYWRVSNQIKFYRKYARGAHLLLLMVFTLARMLGMSLAEVAHGQTDLVRPSVRAWRDGWFEDAPTR